MDSQNSAWHQRMQDDLIVAGMAENTQEAYLRAVRQLSNCYNGTLPTDLTEQQPAEFVLNFQIDHATVPRRPRKTTIGRLPGALPARPPGPFLNAAHNKARARRLGLLEQKTRTRLREFLIHWCWAALDARRKLSCN